MTPNFHKKIYLFNNRITSGGSEKQILLIAEQLAYRGFEVCFLSLRPRYFGNEKIHGHFIKACHAGVTFLEPASESFLHGFVFLLKLFRDVEKECVIWSWGGRAEILAMLLKLMAPKRKHIGSQRSGYPRNKVRHSFLNWCRAFLSEGILANSENGRSLVMAAGGAGRVGMIPNMLSTEDLLENAIEQTTKPSTLHVSLIGNIRYHIKGYDILVRIGQLVAANNLPIVFHVAGGGVDFGYLESQIKTSNLERTILLYGNISDTYHFLRNSNIYMLCSRVEGWPNSLIEAMNLGMPCLSSTVGDLAFINSTQSDEIFKLAPIEDAEEMLSLLNYLWQNWDEAQKMGLRARTFIRTYNDPVRITNELISALEFFLGTK